MSFFPAKDPVLGDAFSCDAIEMAIVPRTVDLGDLTVRRALPSARRRMVGPFIFFDHFGPAEFRSGQGLDVRPHPHIGLATVSYLFDGEIVHRDSLGTLATIKPGDVNWMKAGRGIAHSERTDANRRGGGEHLHGLQCWNALPVAQEESAPDFIHHGVDELPVVAGDGKTVRLIAGAAYGAKAPLETTWDTLFADASLAPADRRRLRGARDLRGGGRGRYRRRPLRLRAIAGAAPGRPARCRRGGRRTRGAGRRRGDGRAAPHLVELRLLAQGAHRAGQG
jgi:redox-sensitive bicupin YhaK (pirin superfamily)